MKCHYEILEVPHNADDAEIKAAYRRLALQWHPDKNPDDPNQAKLQFQQMQQAYEVLSDKQERAWYDNHREQILRGNQSDFKDESLNVFPYFTTSCFKGFSDNPQGFYSVYRSVFEQIVQEDQKFMKDEEKLSEVPSFGQSNTDYEAVKAFYNHWMSYSTKKTYSWVEPYNILEGKGDRRLSKLIEKENKKARLKARKERNEEVRNLVTFVRKRDERVKSFCKELEAKTMENRKKQAKLSKQRRLEQQQMHANETQPEWLKFENLKAELEDIERLVTMEFGHSDNEEEYNENISLYCTACTKIFKNPKAFENHEVSRKHRDNVVKLRAAMAKDDLEANLTKELEEVDLDNSKCSSRLQSSEESTEGISESEEVCGFTTSEVKTKKKKKQRQKILSSGSDVELEVFSKLVDDEDRNFGDVKKNKKKTHKRVKPKLVVEPVEEPVEEPYDGPPPPPVVKVYRRGKYPLLHDLGHYCFLCNINCPSRNKLFEHFKKLDHSVYFRKKVVKSGSV
ncbi:dnaJ homolog subfamily C member 21 [Euwallacea fornicatus]|uniref:dnaJ homolog subfamily C member 21 n=1 Tax=Euwallacea fornicatus TaxID=995702 RepID=UPI00338ED3F4